MQSRFRGVQSRLSLRGAHCQWEVAQRGPGAEQVQRGAEQVQRWLRGGAEGLRGGSEPEGCRALAGSKFRGVQRRNLT